MKILLIEDDPFFQHFYPQKLQQLGYEVEIAQDGEEGLLKMRASLPALILLDLIMPKKNGFEVLAEKATDPQIKDIPVLVFSTLGQEEDIKKALALGAKDFAGKTFFDIDTLTKKIQTLLPNA